MRTTLDIDDPVLRELKRLPNQGRQVLGPARIRPAGMCAEGRRCPHPHCAPGLDRKADGRTRQSLRQGSRASRLRPMTYS